MEFVPDKPTSLSTTLICFFLNFNYCIVSERENGIIPSPFGN